MNGLWLGVLLACGGGGGSAPVAGGEAAESPPPSGDHTTAAIGDLVRFTDRELRVTAVFDHGDTLPPHRGFIADPQPGNRFIEVRFTEKNLRAEPASTLFLPRLEDDSGRSHSGVAVGIAKLYMPKDTFEYRWHTLQPGEEKPFVGLYQVADPSAKGLRLHVWSYNLGEGNGTPTYIPLGL